MLLDAGADINAKSHPLERTPLMLASQKGHISVCQLLLWKGANVNAKTRGLEATALHYAAQNGHDAVCRVLFECGANVDEKTGDELPEFTPLHLARKSQPW